MAPTTAPFVVLKFGGTSVSTAANWRNIKGVLEARLAEGLKPVVVHSALSGVTDRLESLLSLGDRQAVASTLAAIGESHAKLAKELGIPLPDALKHQLDELAQIAAGVTLVNEASDRIRARVLAAGELMATTLGAAWLNAGASPSSGSMRAAC